MIPEATILLLIAALLVLITMIKFTHKTPEILLISCGVFIISGIFAYLDILTPLTTYLFIIGVIMVGLFSFAIILLTSIFG
jgi:hypothetical protein